MRFSSSEDLFGASTFDRLLGAADAILLAEHLPGKGSVIMWRDESKPARHGYSSQELMDAMMFLRRLGLVDLEEPHAIPQEPGRWT